MYQVKTPAQVIANNNTLSLEGQKHIIEMAIIDSELSLDLLDYALDVQGWNANTLENVLYWVTGYHDALTYAADEMPDLWITEKMINH